MVQDQDSGEGQVEDWSPSHSLDQYSTVMVPVQNKVLPPPVSASLLDVSFVFNGILRDFRRTRVTCLRIFGTIWPQPGTAGSILAGTRDGKRLAGCHGIDLLPSVQFVQRLPCAGPSKQTETQ